MNTNYPLNASTANRFSRWLAPVALLGYLAGVNAAFAASEPSLKDIFQSTLACAVVEPLLADMSVEPLFVQTGNGCTATIPDSKQPYFSDNSCQMPVSFDSTPLIEHCELLLDSGTLGEGDGIVSGQWTLSPGSRLDVGAKPLNGVVHPYLQRNIYRTIDTDNGSCELEMRVYANSPIAGSDSPSLLALHGGSWSARGFGFFGLELTIPHYVQQGFVVYAPFYRLLGDSEGSAACNQSDIASIVSDAEAALDWVQDQASRYGSSPKPVVFGQSAGAHLATSLLVNRAEDVSGAILLYPPTDFTDFALRAQQGLYSDEQGLGILERLVGVEAANVDISASPVPENSFPIRIAEQGIDVPPVLMIHGMRDTLVEARQSIRLCNALSGEELLATDQEINAISTLREVIPCGVDGQSQVHLIREGQHALDVCFADFPLATDLCPSGSESSRLEVSQAIADAVVFAAVQANAASVTNSQTDSEEGDLNAGDNIATPLSDSESNESNSGGTVSAWLQALMMLLLAHRWRAVLSSNRQQ